MKSAIFLASKSMVPFCMVREEEKWRFEVGACGDGYESNIPGRGRIGSSYGVRDDSDILILLSMHRISQGLVKMDESGTLPILSRLHRG